MLGDSRLDGRDPAYIAGAIVKLGNVLERDKYLAIGMVIHPRQYNRHKACTVNIYKKDVHWKIKFHLFWTFHTTDQAWKMSGNGNWLEMTVSSPEHDKPLAMTVSFTDLGNVKTFTMRIIEEAAREALIQLP